MATTKRNRTSKKFKYFYLDKKLYRVLRSSRAKDQIIAWSYSDQKRMIFIYSDVVKYMQNAFTLTEVSTILNKHRVTIQDYIIEGKVRAPQKAIPIGKPDSGWWKYIFSEDDIIEIYEFILSSGRNIEDLPNKRELTALLKNNIILYTKTEDGKFIPVWKAD